MSRVLGAVIVAVVLVLGLRGLGDVIYDAAEPAPAGVLKIDLSSGGGGTAMQAALSGPDAGKVVAKQCQVCHSLNQGGANKIGPNLWGIVGAGVASRQGFVYSDALRQSGKVWSPEELDKWIESPRTLYPGTKMTFAGIKEEQKRKDLIAYLETLK